MTRAYDDLQFPPRHRAKMPQDRLDQIPWLICGRMLLTPFAPREGGLLTQEAEAIEAMGVRLERDRCAGRAVPVTLLARRLDPAPMPVPMATRGRPTKARALAEAAT